MKKNHYIGIDVGGTKIAAAIVNQRGEIIEREKYPTPRKASPRQVFDTIEDIIDDVLQDSQMSIKEIAAIGMGIPGLVDPKNNILITPNINLSHYPLAAKLEKKFKTKVFLGNDVNLGLLAEKWLGTAKKFDNVVGLFPGTGIGGAVLIDGKLFIGPHGAAAELGHMIMDIQGPKCSCGNHGCLEALASRWAIERDIREAIRKGQRSVITALAGKNMPVLKSKFLKEALKKRDPLVTRVMHKASTILGHACISIRHTFNPELIVLGGGVMEACGNFILPIVDRIMRSDPFFSKFDHCRVVGSKLEDDAVILGAVALAKQKTPSKH